MGCVGSKPGDSPAVALCRKRCHFLDEAIHQRYALSESHLAYFHSFKSVGDSLQRFFDLHSAAAVNRPSSPVLNLPSQPQRKGDSDSSKPPPAPVIHRRSNSGSSHLHFHSDSDDSDEDDSIHLHSDNGGSSPMHQQNYGNFGYYDQRETLGAFDLPAGYPFPSGGYTVNYMVKQPTPSVLYQQRPVNSEPIRYSEASTSSYYGDNFSNQNPSLDSYNSSYSNYGEFFGGSSRQSYQSKSVLQQEASSSDSKPPPPPPPPPASSGWDFLNPFDSFQSYYPPHAPSLDSREVREKEGIPDLEDDNIYQHEVVKEVQGNQKFVDSGDAGSKKTAVVDEGNGERAAAAAAAAAAADLDYRTVPNVTAKEVDPVEHDVHVVEKVAENQKKPNVYHNDSEVVKAIHTEFDCASELGKELAKILEVGKVPHNRKHDAYQVPSKMLNVFTPSLLRAPPDPATLDVDVDLLTKSKNLSSTLHKLYLWEKKLFDEVKIEEKMRLLHEEKRQRLVRLDEKGAEPHKVDATRTSIRNLSTKIRIGIQVVEKISKKINNLRDEELWPQLNDFIQGVTRMWRSMLECHHSQCEAIGAAKQIDSIASHKHSSDAILEATLQLEHELLNWAIRFSCWFGAQKGFVRALNEWLLNCLTYEPEETVDGPVPYSPGRIGAPAIFIICNQWAQAMQRISDNEVVDSMRDFAAAVLQLWERDKVELRQRAVVDKNRDRSLDKADQKIQKELQLLDKMITVSSGNDMSFPKHVYQSDTSKTVSLQTGLRRVFESLEQFTASSLKAYEELLQRIQNDNLGV